jgi:C1A family cysteine protease
LIFQSCGQKDEMASISNVDTSTTNDIDLQTFDLLKTGKLSGVPNQSIPSWRGAILLSQEAYSKIPGLQPDELLNLKSGGAELRSSGSILNLPPVYNQGNEGSCVAFAAGYAMMSYYLKWQRRMTYDNTSNSAYRSPEFLYNLAKIPGGCDAGTDPISALNTLYYKGICSWADMPYSSSNGCSTQPNPYQLSRAAQVKIKSFSRLTNEYQVKQALDYGHPVLLAFQLDKNFEAQTSQTPYVYSSVGGAKTGGHAVVIKGYDDANQVFICQNSWGKNVHYYGNFYMSYGAFRRIYPQLFVINGLGQ